jgi:hypothetical protein
VAEGVASVADTKRTLLLTLGSMGAASAATGVTLLARGRRGDYDRAFCRQFIMWGAIDLAIAVAGYRREQRGAAHATSESDELRALHRILVINSALDVGYLASGATLIVAAERLGGRFERYSPDAARGDGSGVMIQAAMLLALDTVFAVRTH